MELGDFESFAFPFPEALFLVSGSGDVLAANPAALTLLNVRPGEVAGKRLSELVAEPPEQVDTYLAACRRSTAFTLSALTWCVEGREPVRRRVYGSRVGASNPGALMLRVSADEASRFRALTEQVQALAREEAEHRRTGEELHRYRLRLESVLDNSVACIYLKDAGGRYILINRRYEEVTGVSKDNVADKTDREIFPPEVARGFRVNDLTVLERGAAMEFEEVLPQADGEHTFLSLKFPVPDPVTGQAGVGGISTDITARKRMDEQLRQTQKLESLGVLAGGVAHDFNNLLTGILGNASVARELLPNAHPALSAIREVMNAGERAAHLTRQLLAYAGKGRFVVERLDLSVLIREIANLVRLSIPRSVTLRLDLAPNLPQVEADPGQIQQLAMNLAINGAEAIGDGNAGSVIVTTGVQHADEEYATVNFPGQVLAPGAYVSLEVHDTGCGMDSATLARIFEPFFTTKFTGRGLGLSAVQGIVRSHKGALRVYSAPGSGTTFRVLLPAAPAAAEGREIQAPPTELQGSGTVLVVDDEELVRRTARLMLERYGYSVLTADDGREAVEMFRRRKGEIQLVLLDLTMPVMGGEEAFRELRVADPAVKVLLSSGYNEVEAIRKFTTKGIAGFIQKPYTAARLAEKVKQILETPR